MKMQCIGGARLSRRFIRIGLHGSGKHRSRVELEGGDAPDKLDTPERRGS